MGGGYSSLRVEPYINYGSAGMTYGGRVGYDLLARHTEERGTASHSLFVADFALKDSNPHTINFGIGYRFGTVGMDVFGGLKGGFFFKKPDDVAAGVETFIGVGIWHSIFSINFDIGYYAGVDPITEAGISIDLGKLGTLLVNRLFINRAGY